MRFLPYLVILIVGVGTLLLGVELMTLSQKPATQLASAPNRLAQHEADQRAEKTEGDASRPLTPLYPANPGGAKDVRVVYPQNNQPSNQPAAATETIGAALANEQKADIAATADAPAAQPQQAQAAESQQENTNVPLPPQKLQTAKPEEQSSPKPVQLAAVRAINHCDVQTCTNAYASFRASDCTYQPFEGARRVCSAPPAQRSVEREVSSSRAAQLPRRAEPREEPAGYADDEDDDADAPIGSGQRVIILDRGDRPWR